MNDIRNHHAEWERENLSAFDQLMQLAQVQPTIHSCLTSWRNGQCSFERCLLEMVLALSKQNQQLVAQIGSQLRYSREPSITLTEEQKRKLIEERDTIGRPIDLIVLETH